MLHNGPMERLLGAKPGPASKLILELRERLCEWIATQSVVTPAELRERLKQE